MHACISLAKSVSSSFCGLCRLGYLKRTLGRRNMFPSQSPNFPAISDNLHHTRRPRGLWTTPITRSKICMHCRSSILYAFLILFVKLGHLSRREGYHRQPGGYAAKSCRWKRGCRWAQRPRFPATSIPPCSLSTPSAGMSSKRFSSARVVVSSHKLNSCLRADLPP